MVRLAVRTTGMMTAAGCYSGATYAALRAGVSGIQLATYRDPDSGEPITAGRCSLWQWWEGTSKLVALLAPAVQECLSVTSLQPSEIPLLIGTSDPKRPFRFPRLDEDILPGVEEKLGVRFHPASEVISRDNVSAVVGILRAQELIEQGKAQSCIVAGVDSYLQRNVVQAYIEDRRVLTAANSNGFIPGEAGTAMLLSPAGNERTETGEVHILGTSLTHERATITSVEPTRAEGLVRAVRQALDQAQLDINVCDYRITDLNGEEYKFKEAAYLMIGVRRSRTGLFDLWHPIEYVGEIGAAVGPCVLGWALHAGQKGYAPGATALCHFSNDNGERAAAVIRFESGEKK